MDGIIKEALFLAADVGLALLFYQLYRSRCVTADMIMNIEQVSLSSENLWTRLKNAPGQCLEYVGVAGLATGLCTPLKSQYTDDTGLVRSFKREIIKSQRIRGMWTNSNETISSTYEKIPFALYESGGTGSVLVVEPKLANYFEEAFVTTCNHFEPASLSFLESTFGRISGDITKGYQTTEQLLKNQTPLLGFGKLVLNENSLELRPPKVSGSQYILTSMSIDELVTSLKSKATIFKVLTIIFGITGVVIFYVSFGRRFRVWLEHHRQEEQLNAAREHIQQMRETSNEENNTENNVRGDTSCVICLSAVRNICFRPCGHVCICVNCCEAMSTPKLCPVCRTGISAIIPVYIP